MNGKFGILLKYFAIFNKKKITIKIILKKIDSIFHVVTYICLSK